AGDFPAGDLPAGLADPLHLGHSPWPEVFAWLAVLGVLALLAWAYAGRRRRAAAPAPAPRPAAPAAPASGGDDALAARIRELHQRHATSLEVRAGCHRLSALTREHLERG
ncbi:MAG: hypothetical protein KDD11_20635, partial [Acidobacteria bacterium]|nr:hypothetical protein [Acidobacteriota bacterium]